jgi:Icc-related predicted phosphoesterase
VLDGSAYERDGVGFAGTKGFVGGFGRGVLTAFGEPEVKTFVRASIDEALKLERAMSQLRTPKRIVVLHYAPIAATVQGEAPEIFPFLGTSRLAEVIDRHGADFVVHGHAHNGFPDGATTAGVPVHNVAITLLQSQKPPMAYRIFDV